MRLILIALLLPATATADPALECSDAGSQVEIGSCVGEMDTRVSRALQVSFELAVQSAKELDEVTGRIVAEPALIAAQQAWETYRDTHCTAVGASFGGGSGTGIAITSCRVNLGRARVEELLSFAN